MNNFKEVIEIIKDCICVEMKNKGTCKGPVLDQTVAKQIQLSSSAMATAKSRNVIPFEAISVWCAKNKIAINSILFSQSVESLIDNTNEMVLNRYQIIH